MFLLLSGNLLFESGTIEGKKNFDCGLKFLLYRVFNLNCKKGVLKKRIRFTKFIIYTINN